MSERAIPTRQQRVVLAGRPEGDAAEENFRLEEVEIAPLADGQVLVRHHFLSLDPYMRGRMSDGKSYAQPQPLGETMIGGTVGEVVASRNSHFAVGDKVIGMGGWQQFAIVDASQRGVLQKIADPRLPLSAWLGAAGMPGVTAWYGLVKIIDPKPGQTVVVSAASGAVGSAVGQLAKARGARAVGIAGGPEKCRYVVDELGFDACIDHREHGDAKSMSKALKEACPDGIDGHFENVGGVILDAVMLRANAFSRVALCGFIAGYDGRPIPLQAPQLMLVNRMRVEGFIVSEHMEFWPEALKELSGRVLDGSLKYRETVAEGLAQAPAAFIGLLKGRNFGKQLVRLT